MPKAAPEFVTCVMRTSQSSDGHDSPSARLCLTRAFVSWSRPKTEAAIRKKGESRNRRRTIGFGEGPRSSPNSAPEVVITFDGSTASARLEARAAAVTCDRRIVIVDGGGRN